MRVLPLFTLLCCLFWCNILVAQKADSIKNTPLYSQPANTPMVGWLNDLARQHSVRFYYRYQWLAAHTVTASYQGTPLGQALTTELNKIGLTYTLLYNNHFILLPISAANTGNPANEPQAVVAEAVNRLAIGTSKQLNAQGLAVLTGAVVAAENNEPLIGATVTLQPADGSLATGTITNINGGYQIAAPPGNYTVVFSYLGWQSEQKEVSLQGTGSLNTALFEETVQLGGVVISGRAADANISNVQMSTTTLQISAIKKIPAFLGEADVVKSLILLPGVTTLGEGAAGFNVRGGDASQNLILFDGAPLFNSSHLFGFFSVFHPDIVSEATLYRGGMPARYGQRSSSVLEVNTKEGSYDQFSVKGGVGLVASRLMAEGPLAKNKASFAVAARQSYSDWVLDLANDIDINQSSASFYDLTAKLSYRPSHRNKINITGYHSQDRFRLAADTSYAYSNTLLTGRYSHSFGQRLVAYLGGFYSQYQYDIEGLRPLFDFTLRSGIRHAGGDASFTWQAATNYRIDAGMLYGAYWFELGQQTPNSSNSTVSPVTLEEEQAVTWAAWTDHKLNLGKSTTLLLGLRYAQYQQRAPGQVRLYQPGTPRTAETVTDTLFQGSGNLATYNGFEPRASLKVGLAPTQSLKLSIGRMRQFIHLISNTAAITPLAFWKSSDSYLEPQVVDQVALGYFRNFMENTIEASVEVYYKQQNQVVDYKNGASLILNPALETELVATEGRAYGIELLVRKTLGRLTGWASYTLSKTERRTVTPFAEDQINQGSYYPADFDIPHNLTVATNYQITRRWRASANFVYNTGRPVSFPLTRYRINDVSVAYFAERNGFRIPDYHRLDLSVTLEGSNKRNKKWQGSWTFSIYNVYGRKNAYSVFFGTVPIQGFSTLEAFKLTVVGVPFPAITYNFEF